MKCSINDPFVFLSAVMVCVDRGGSNVFECSLCNVMVTSEDQLNTHLKGMKHQNKMKQASGKNRPRGRGRGGFRGGRGGRGQSCLSLAVNGELGLGLSVCAQPFLTMP